MDSLLQIWGGFFYLLNKSLFVVSERERGEGKRRFSMLAWSAYLIGAPAWVIILTAKHSWIAVSVEIGGIPAMFLGLYNAYHCYQKPSRLLNHFVTFFTYGSLIFGLTFSVIHHGGIVSVSQLLELGVMVGFLVGGYLMAKNNPKGWLFFIVMNVSMAALMCLQDKYILMSQQCLSLLFVVYGYKKSTSLS